VAQDWRDARIAELEAALAASAAELAVERARVAQLEQQVAALGTLVAELLSKLGQNSRNSHRPPSTDSPAAREQRRGKGKKGKRKRGGQPGHRGAHRELLPPEQVNAFVNLFPGQCESCWKPLPEKSDPLAKRYQVTEVPPITPHTTEYRRHTVRCPGCGHATCAAFDERRIPASSFGPRLMALMALLTGVYHLSRRRTTDLLSDMVGVRVSLGALSAVEARVSAAVEPAVDEAWAQVHQAEVKHTDGTGWLQSGVTLSLWTIATALVTVFKIVANGSKQTLQPLYGALSGILVSDRAQALNFWAMDRRQICWAHLLRKFVSFAERDGPAGAVGRDLLDYTGILFDYWHDYRDGKLSRERFVAWMIPIRQQMEAALDRAAQAGLEHVSGSCADILAHAQALWTFVDFLGVDPTNNHAERELRAFVLWRRRSFGSQSERGNLFAERLMTVAHTARKQKRHVLTFLTACCLAQRDHTSSPSLFGAAA
jgi:transposase